MEHWDTSFHPPRWTSCMSRTSCAPVGTNSASASWAWGNLCTHLRALHGVELESQHLRTNSEESRRETSLNSSPSLIPCLASLWRAGCWNNINSWQLGTATASQQLDDSCSFVGSASFRVENIAFHSWQHTPECLEHWALLCVRDSGLISVMDVRNLIEYCLG